jgi:hypothetical protein
MTVRDLVAHLQLIDPDTEVLVRTVTGADYTTEWDPIDSVEPVAEETVFVMRDGRYGYHKALCVRLWA